MIALFLVAAVVVVLRRLHSIAMVTRKLPHSLLVCVIARAKTDLGWRSVHLKVKQALQALQFMLRSCELSLHLGNDCHSR